MTDSTTKRTLLSKELARLRKDFSDMPEKGRATPLDAFNVAARDWIDGKRIDVGRIADELGVARATVFRWVGSREQLIGEVIWSLCIVLWKDAVKHAKGTGADYVADISYRVMDGILAADPLRRFLEQDPEFALRILTSKSSIVQARIVGETAKVLRELEVAGHIKPAVDVDSLAYLLVRVVESFTYSDQITGRQPNIEIAREAIRILVAAEPRSGAEKKISVLKRSSN